MTTRLETKSLLIGVVAALVALTISAQELDIAALHELDDDRTDITYQGFTVDELEDMDVVRNGEVIGEVEEVLADSSGQIVALVVEYGGNRFGIGEREVVVPIERFVFGEERRRVETKLTDDELAELPEWDD
jgi:sporulation protein YlmC with PRC-barrel domain